MKITELSRAWNLPTPWQIEPMMGSSSNHLALITADNNQKAVLCTFAHEQPQQLAYVHEVLGALSTHALSFQVPTPMHTRTGEYWHMLDDGYRNWLMTLTPWYDGEHPDADEVSVASLAGSALAELLNTLAQVQTTTNSPTSYAQLHRIHPYVIDPVAALRAAPLDTSTIQHITELVTTLQQQLPELYESLPQQIIHGDFTPRNILIHDQKINAVLDFELCRHDIRALDIAVAILSWGGFDADHRADALTAFFTAVQRDINLTDAELHALPSLLRLVRVVRLLHALGRFQQGIERSVVVERAAASLLTLDTWLIEHPDALMSAQPESAS
jgi:homoserine kinase type II